MSRERGDHSIDGFGIELYSFGEVSFGTAPVTGFEPVFGAAGNASEIIVVLFKCFVNSLASLERKLAMGWVSHAISQSLQTLNQGRAEFAALDFLCVVHQSREVISHDAIIDRAVHRLDEHVCDLGPAQITEHHFARQQQ